MHGADDLTRRCREQFTRHAMTSPEFAADMAGFDANEIVDVQSVLLDPTLFSPIR
jgi:hypothetical protein